MDKNITLHLVKEYNGGWFFDKPIRRLEKESYGYYINISDGQNVLVDSGDIYKCIGCRASFPKENFGGFTHKEYPKTLIFASMENAMKWFSYVKKELFESGYNITEEIEG